MSRAHTKAKGARIDLRISEAEKDLIERAALAEGEKLSEFVLRASTAAAQQALAEQNRFELPEAQMSAFLSRLEASPVQNDRLRELFRRTDVFE